MTMAHSCGQAAASIPGELVARLEVAEAGSRELDAAVCDALIPVRPVKRVVGRGDYDGNAFERKRLFEASPTTSLDAALALAERLGLSPSGVLKAAMYWAYQADASDNASTIARYACIAILRDAALMASVEAEATTAPETGAVGTSASECTQPGVNHKERG